MPPPPPRCSVPVAVPPLPPFAVPVPLFGAVKETLPTRPPLATVPVTAWPGNTAKRALITAPAPPRPPLVAATPEDAPAPPRVLVIAEQVPSGTVVETAPAVVCEKLAALAAGLAKAGVLASAVAKASTATPLRFSGEARQALLRSVDCMEGI